MSAPDPTGPAAPHPPSWGPAGPALRRRDPWLHGILAFLTLGISAYYWCYVTIRDGREHRGQAHRAGLLTGLSIGFLAGGVALMFLLFLPLVLAGLGAFVGFGGGRDPGQAMQELIAAGVAAVLLTILGMFVAFGLLAVGAVLRYVLLYQAAGVVGALAEDAGRDRPVPAFVYPLATVVTVFLGIPLVEPLAWGASVAHLQIEWNRSLEGPLPVAGGGDAGAAQANKP